MSLLSLALLLLGVSSTLLPGQEPLSLVVFMLFLVSLLRRRSRKRPRDGAEGAAAPPPRPMKILGSATKAAPAGDLRAAFSSEAELAQHAQQALGTLDPIVREPLLPGMPVVICLGEGGRCGTVLLADVFEDLQREGRAECPSCRTRGHFIQTLLAEGGAAKASMAALEEGHSPPITWHALPQEDDNLWREDDEDLGHWANQSPHQGIP